MYRIQIFILLIFSHFVVRSQIITPAADSFFIKSIPTYDINGNYYSYEKKLDYLPTKEDTVLFYKEMDAAFRPVMDSVERSVEMQRKRIDEMNRKYYADQKQYAQFYPREGRHLFSLHWISWKKFGSAVVKKVSKNKYSIKGSQKDTKGNYVTIDGYLIPLKKGLLKFSGEIVTRTSGNNDGMPCVKKGEYTFLCSPGRKYWRLQEMENCEGDSLVDYVDIFF